MTSKSDTLLETKDKNQSHEEETVFSDITPTTIVIQTDTTVEPLLGLSENTDERILGLLQRKRKRLIKCVVGVLIAIVAAATIIGLLCYFKPNSCLFSSKEEGATDKVIGTNQITGTKGENQCLYVTNQKYLDMLDEDPFGDSCSRDAPECQSSQATQQCEKCNNGLKFPAYCFCDKKVHCENKSGRPYDHPSKVNCSFCLRAFNFTNFTSRGNCTCAHPNGFFGQSYCTCNPGYGGFMCSSVTKRVCTVTKEEQDLKNCSDSNDEKCFLETRKEGKVMSLVCDSFKDLSDMYKGLKNCDAGS